jgi:CRP-like cAMP-binding protein
VASKNDERFGVFFRRLELRDRITDEEKAVLIEAFDAPELLPVQSAIVREGERPTKSVLVLSGISCRTRTLRNGERQIVAVHLPGDFVDLHGFLLKTMDHDVEALTPCVVARLPHPYLERITERFPHLTRLLWLLTLIDAAIIREWAVGLGVRSASERMAHLFCELNTRLTAIGLAANNTFLFPVAQSTLKDILGLSAVHTNRTLMDLRQRNLVSWEKGILTILDPKRLYEEALFDEGYLHLNREPR